MIVVVVNGNVIDVGKTFVVVAVAFVLVEEVLVEVTVVVVGGEVVAIMLSI